MAGDSWGDGAATFGAIWSCACCATALAYAAGVQEAWPPSPRALAGLAILAVALAVALAMTLARPSTGRAASARRRGNA